MPAANMSSPATPSVAVDPNGVYLTPPTSTTPQAAREYGQPNLNTNQVSVGLTATQIAAARSARGAITIVNHGTNPVYIGTGSVSATTGLLLPGVVGASVTLPYNGQVSGIATGGAQTVSFLETY